MSASPPVRTRVDRVTSASRPFIGEPLIDRCHADRDDPLANAARWADPGALLLSVGAHDEVAVLPGATPEDTVRLAPTPTSGERDDQRQLLIGVVQGRPWFITRDTPRAAAGQQIASLRSLRLGPVAREIVWAGLAFLHWAESQPMCPSCHGTTRLTSGGPTRVCTACGREVFPRTDPAVISAVVDRQDRIALGRQPSWAPGRVSVLAGFVEAGEAAEHALVREVAEETGLRVTAARYLSSQPWPFPRSLMLGYVARAEGTISDGDHELDEARFYSRDQVRDLVAGGGLILPTPMSIARSMVDGWLDNRLPSPESGTDLSVPLSL
ncbi:MAG: NAD(+) diphosphatase [Acidipropionibacterium jensenii]|nr:NAD(+) diphosphatase [Acidipropionibacterium jensenii]MDN5997588.1 NAD(+) diphosphatase [Acidipropionibacterium jensenii]MDN6426916.1 NAD(+) diphosphatase [Acidipropionibacterium jensenii]MDN6440886.1 NAD(+) diphosphatase [Acidipropionibacterium jensenii]MDN6479552.1 NAD(+) diphosphatase [Acidipropionibacterium jensenii]MDN6512551.1 NAD(+) diphosphatase [Acidipropionibacterium jensenii]